MPTFEFNKLVRSKLLDEYKHLGQEVEIKELTKEEHKRQLVKKVLEEVLEIDFDKPEDIQGEIADVRQALDDLAAICNINEADIKITQQNKFDKKGGFSECVFVKTIKLAKGDKWVRYYRQTPDKYLEKPEK